ncbi:MAG: Gfo/Idh/MocA family oxidoreductase [Deltaproteobacteria bacterium]|nr:Gfo/Idh/MocA family oxidoreductase [Deltaproteobacteria bacterium]
MKKIRYAVVGLGYISQVAVLPAFRHAKKNSILAALISSDHVKLRKLGAMYGVTDIYSYEEYDECLQSGKIDAVYISMPNSHHHEYTLKAANAGIHVLCEKPMALTVPQCQEMIEVATQGGIKLMIAYRLHFESANLHAIEIARSGRLGELRYFHSMLSMQVKEGNSRLQPDLGGGSLYDIGIYCINAARNLFQEEPQSVFATSLKAEVDEQTTVLLSFSNGRTASFTCSFIAADKSFFELVGTKGSIRLEPAYELAEPLRLMLTIDGQTKEKKFKKGDQFAPELLYFSNCILEGKEPEPSGQEGLADIRIISALFESLHTGLPISLAPFRKSHRPNIDQEIKIPAFERPELIHAEAPST